jgi:GH24 family phage-related lysozyme (muramidase)
MIEQLLRDLKAEEGFRSYVYDDFNGEPIVPGYTLKGHPTIWYGLCVEKGRVPYLPPNTADDALAYVATAKWHDLLKRLPWLANQPEDVQRALAHMAFQLGVEGTLGFSLMLAALERGDRETAAINALDSAWSRQTPARAQRVAELIAGHGT